MTISVCVVVNDGLVLASDSATTIRLSNGDAQVYNNADKIFNLYKDLPIGAATWGLGSIGGASMATLSKDFRRILSSVSTTPTDPDAAAGGINVNDYTIQDVAARFVAFLQAKVDILLLELDETFQRKLHAFEEEQQANPDGAANPPEPTVLGSFFFRIVGYDASGGPPQIWEFDFDGRIVNAPRQQHAPISWGGQGEAVQRIVLGVSDGLVAAIRTEANLTFEDSLATVKSLMPHVEAPLVNPAMPIMDAIDLAEFLVDAAIKYSRFIPGAPTIGGPIEIATITKHEGFRWIKRKHFFESRLNPPK